MQAVILAGGLGTRLGALTRNVPKAMAPVNGRPFLEYEIELLRRSGVEEIVLCVGHLGEMIEGHFEDGRRWGVSIEYSRDGPQLLGVAGALKRASHLLDERFFVTYGDAYLRVDYAGMWRRLDRSPALALMAVYRNNDRYGKSDLIVRRGHVVMYDKKRSQEGMVWINYGVSLLSAKALEHIPAMVPYGEEEFYGRLIGLGQLLAYRTARRFYEIGTPPALVEFERFITRSDKGTHPG